jgi:hypothetical protein
MQDAKDTDCVVLAAEVELDGRRVPCEESRVYSTLAKDRLIGHNSTLPSTSSIQ